jgi:hypothetical protein
MSTTMYLQCLSHDPPLLSDEVGQHTLDLDDIRGYIANKDHLIALIKADIPIGGQQNPPWASTAGWFMYRHPKCEIGIVDQYGSTYLTGINDPKESQNA